MKLLAPILRRLGFAPLSEVEQLRRIINHEGISTRSFNAAAINRLTGDWSAMPISLDSVLRCDLTALRARVEAEATRNNPYLVKFLTMSLSNILGHEGITLKNKASDPIGFKNGEIIPGKLDVLANKLIEDAWWDWGKKENCNVAKDLNWLETNQLALKTTVKQGETIWRHITGSAAGNKYNYALQPISTSRIDLTRTEHLSDGGSIKMGIQRNAAGKQTHVWLYDSDPTDTVFGARGWNSKPYDLNEFVRPYLIHEIGQTCGFPWPAPAMLRAKMLDGYEEAHLEGTRAAACKMGFLKKTGDGNGYAGENADGGGKYMDAEPGMIEELPIGMDFQPADWNYPNGGYGEFVKDCLRGIAAGLGVSYNTLANDLEGVNFSSGRLGLMDEREMWKVLQAWWATNFCAPIFSKWLENALMSGAIALELPSGDRKPLPLSKFQKFNQPCWHGRRWQWVDPEKEVNAKTKEIRSGFTTPSRVLAEMGQDEDEVLEEMAQFKTKAEGLGLKFPDLFDEHKAAELDPEVEKLNRVANAYGVCVRAGVITPNEKDESYFREQIGMPASPEVSKAWAEEKSGVRRPITLVPASGEVAGFGGKPADGGEGEPKEE